MQIYFSKKSLTYLNRIIFIKIKEIKVNLENEYTVKYFFLKLNADYQSIH